MRVRCDFSSRAQTVAPQQSIGSTDEFHNSSSHEAEDRDDLTSRAADHHVPRARVRHRVAPMLTVAANLAACRLDPFS